jgi:hypothetical protein
MSFLTHHFHDTKITEVFTYFFDLYITFHFRAVVVIKSSN